MPTRVKFAYNQAASNASQQPKKLIFIDLRFFELTHCIASGDVGQGQVLYSSCDTHALSKFVPAVVDYVRKNLQKKLNYPLPPSLSSVSL